MTPSLLSRLCSWLQSGARRPTSRPRPSPAGLRLEALEDRVMPSTAPWPMVFGDASNTSQSPYAATRTGELDWVAGTVGVWSTGTPVIGPNGLFFRSRSPEVLKALNFDGSLAWRFDPTPYASSDWGLSVGNDGTVYVTTSNGDGNPGSLLAIDPNTPGAYVDANRNLIGGVKWQATTAGTGKPPLISPDGTIYVSGFGGNVDAFSLNGTRKWRFNTGSYGYIGLSNDGATLYATNGTGRTLFAIDTATGQQKWRFRAKDNLLGAPTISPDGTIYVIDSGWYLNALTTDGSSKWRVSLGKPKSSNKNYYQHASVTADGKSIYAPGWDGLYAISSAGAVKWKYPSGGWGESDPALGADGMIYSQHFGTIHALTPSGTLAWSGPGNGPIAIGADGTLYTGQGDLLFAYKTGGVGRPTAGYLLATPSPVAAGGQLSLLAYDVRDETAVGSVSFYQDTDGISGLTAGDTLVGTNQTGPSVDGAGYYYWGIDITAPVAGTYTYFAQATDAQGHLSNVVSTTVNVGSPLLAASLPTAPTPEILTDAAVAPLGQEALLRWQTAGVASSDLGGISVQIADLGGATLGMVSGNTILIDDNAAGWGWFVDPTPRNDSEFTTPGDQGEQGKIDLLTVLTHEMGHLLGLEHSTASGDVMNATLTSGVRLMPTAGDLPGSTLAGISPSHSDDAFKAYPHSRALPASSHALDATDALFAELARKEADEGRR